jgi:hypothetical protein
MEEEGSFAVVLAGEASWPAERGLLVLDVVEGDEGKRRGRYNN